MDQILIDHLRQRMKTVSRAADVRESRYGATVEAMKARDSDIKLSRKVGGVLAGARIAKEGVILPNGYTDSGPMKISKIS